MTFLASLALIAGCANNHNVPATGASGAPLAARLAAATAAADTALFAVTCQPNPPQGCYTTAQSSCAACPEGYDVSGNTCVVSTSAPCAPSAWNGFACHTPQGFGCPAGTSFSCLEGGCIAPSCTGAAGFLCVHFGVGNVMFYMSGAPASGAYFNGFGWNQLQTGSL